MAVALTALALSITGNGLAAKSLITGKDIKNGSIASKDLAPGAVKQVNIADGAVTGIAIAPGSVTANSIGGATVCDDGTIAFGVSCPAPPQDGAPGAPGADAGTSITARGTFAGNPPLVSTKFLSITGDPAKVDDQPIKVATVSAAVPQQARDVTATVIGTWPAHATQITVALLINDVGVSVDSLTCSITDPSHPSCTVPGPVAIPASARLAWAVTMFGANHPPDPPVPVEDFDLSLGFRTTLG
jgi:hypothetical protein